MLPQPGTVEGPLFSPRAAMVVLGLIAAAALVVVAIVGLNGDSGGGGGHAAGRAENRQHGGGSQTTTSSAESQAQPARVSLELRATDSVWVCLIDDRGRQLIDAETLTPEEARGPFKARAFKVTFGNGAVQISVDGEPVAVPDAGEPFGYRITPQGVSELGPAARPTCI
jgi:hypothetical protein